MKKQNQKGFTLAELLIVVAIIAVLVAIAIPVFTKRLEASRETTDIANLRSAYAAATVAVMSETMTDGDYFFDPNSAVGYSTVSGAKLGKGTAVDGGADVSALPSVCSGYKNVTPVQGKDIKITIASGNVTAIAFNT